MECNYIDGINGNNKVNFIFLRQAYALEVEQIVAIKWNVLRCV